MQPGRWHDDRNGSLTESVMRGHYLLVSSHEALERSGMKLRAPETARRRSEDDERSRQPGQGDLVTHVRRA